MAAPRSEYLYFLNTSRINESSMSFAKTHSFISLNIGFLSGRLFLMGFVLLGVVMVNSLLAEKRNGEETRIKKGRERL